MIICLIGLVVGSSIVATLFHHGAGDRTYAAHYVAAVGHGSRNSTFIISYVGLNPVIIEFPEGQNSEEYRLPLLVNDASDFTLSFRDVNHDHKVDMIVTVDKVDYVYLNDGKKFVFQKLGI